MQFLIFSSNQTLENRWWCRLKEICQFSKMKEITLEYVLAWYHLLYCPSSEPKRSSVWSYVLNPDVGLENNFLLICTVKEIHPCFTPENFKFFHYRSFIHGFFQPRENRLHSRLEAYTYKYTKAVKPNVIFQRKF